MPAVRPAWLQVVDVESRAVAWVDDAVWDAWVARAVELSSPAVRARFVAQGGSEAALAAAITGGGLAAELLAAQRREVRALVEAVAWCYRAADTPPLADPVFVREVLSCVNGDFGEERLAGDPVGLGAWVDRFAPFLFEPGYAVETHRTRLNDDAQIVGRDLELDPFSWASSGDRRRELFTPAGGVKSLWQTGVIVNRCSRRMDFGDCQAWDAEILPPLEWEFDLWARLAASLYTRGARTLQREAREYALARNLRVLRAWRGGGQNTLDLIGAAEAAELEGAASNQSLGTVLFTLASSAAAINPIAGLVLAIPAAIASFAPATYGQRRDVWGRPWPSFQRWRISGGASSREAPATLLEVPAGFVRPPTGRLRVIAPESVEGVAVRVDGGEWRPLLWDGDVPAGVHLVEVRAPDRVGYGVTVRVGAGETVERLVEVRSLPLERDPSRVARDGELLPGMERGAPGPAMGGKGTRGTKKRETIEGEPMAAVTEAELLVEVSTALATEGVEVMVEAVRAGGLASDAPPTRREGPAGWFRPPQRFLWDGAVNATVSARGPGRPLRAQQVPIAAGAKARLVVDAASLPREGTGGGEGGGEVSYSLRRVWTNHKGKVALGVLALAGATALSERDRLLRWLRG